MVAGADLLRECENRLAAIGFARFSRAMRFRAFRMPQPWSYFSVKGAQLSCERSLLGGNFVRQLHMQRGADCF
jgi:hypothetical protein